MAKETKEYLVKSEESHLSRIIISIIIIGILAALILPKFLGRMSEARQKAAIAQMEMLKSALDNFRLDVGRYPTTEEGLKALREKLPDVDRWEGPYLQAVPPDPWGRPYIYKCPGDHEEYDLISYGADAVEVGEGENQDVVNWENP